MTGGRAFAIDDGRPVGDAAAALTRETHDQYVICYRSPDSAGDGKHHRIAVKVRRAADVRRLSLFYRSGYRAASGVVPGPLELARPGEEGVSIIAPLG
jgi:hypothetical protein